MPVRKIPRNARSLTGVVAGGTSDEFESSLERDLILLLKFDPRLVTIESQPLRIPVPGAARPYTPDVLATFRESDAMAEPAVWVYEVKYRNELAEKWKELKPKFKAAIAFGKDHEFRFKIMTEVEIRTPYLENVRFLTPYLREELIDERWRTILRTLEVLREATPAELIAASARSRRNQGRCLYVLWQMVARRMIHADLSLPLTMKSALWTVGAAS